MEITAALNRGRDGEPMRILFGVMSVGGFAGLLGYLRARYGAITLCGLILSVATSAFVGLEIHFLLKALNMSSDMQFALSGICGYSGGALLDAAFPLLLKYVSKKLGIEAPEIPKRRASDYEEKEEEGR